MKRQAKTGKFVQGRHNRLQRGFKFFAQAHTPAHKPRQLLRLGLLVVVFFSLETIVYASLATPLVYVTPQESTLKQNQRVTISVNVQDINFLFSYGVKLRFNPRVLNVTNITEGPFLSQAVTTAFVQRVFDDYVDVACTTLGVSPGVNGSGTLFNVTFVALKPGRSDLTMFDHVLLRARPHQEPPYEALDHDARGGVIRVSAEESILTWFLSSVHWLSLTVLLGAVLGKTVLLAGARKTMKLKTFQSKSKTVYRLETLLISSSAVLIVVSGFASYASQGFEISDFDVTTLAHVAAGFYIIAAGFFQVSVTKKLHGLAEKSARVGKRDPEIRKIWKTALLLTISMVAVAILMLVAACL